MRSDAETVTEYLSELPEDRRSIVEAVRQVILDHLPEGYEEAMNWGMITYQVPLETYPDTYNKKPLMVAALASQKRHVSLYLTPIYIDEDRRDAFEKAYKATGKPYDAGKSCVRFTSLDDLPLDLVGDVIASTDVDTFIEEMKAMRANR